MGRDAEQFFIRRVTMHLNTRTILIADDEPDILEILQFNLQNEGYEVITAKNGDEAIEAAKKKPASPHHS